MATTSGWLLIGVAVLAPSVWVLVRAATARSSEELGLWAGWANILALPVAALGMAIIVVDRVRTRPEHPRPDDRRTGPPSAGPPWMSHPAEDVVERAELLDLLRSYLLADNRGTIGITAVHGAGGFGKTTLAAQASVLPELRNRYPGGLLWVTVGQSMTGPALAQAVNDVIEQLTGTRPTLITPEQAGYRLGTELSARPPCLLIVDDVWTAEQARPFLQGGEPCTRLITTRVPALLPASSRLIEVDEMSRVEAALLLGRGIPDLPPHATTALLALTGRWPLLTALVNGVLRRRIARGDPVEAAVTAVERQLSVDGPTTLDVRVTAERERAVDLTVRASLDLLPTAAQERFLELGAFPEDVEIPSAITHLLWSRRAGGDPPERLRATFADLSLVRRGQDGLVLHEVLRTYARHRLGGDVLRQVNDELVGEARTLVAVGGAPTRPFPWWQLPVHQLYLWRHICYHLDEAGHDGELATTATRLEFVSTKIQLLGVAAVEVDLALVPGDHAAALRSRLSTSAHLLAPTTPAASFPWLLAGRLQGIPILADAVRAFEAVLPAGPRLVLAWPLPDLGPSSLDRVVVGGLGWLQTCAVSASGHWMVAGSNEGPIGVWERATGLPLARLTGHVGEVTAVQITPDDAWIVSAGEDGTVRIWDAARRKSIHTLALFTAKANHCAVTSDSATLAAVGEDGTLQVADITTGRPLLNARVGDEPLDYCAFVDPHTVLTVAHYGRVVTCDVRTGRCEQLLAPHDGVVVSAAVLAENGSWIALTGIDDQILVFPLTAGGGEPAELTGHEGFVTSLVADGDRLISGGWDGTIRIWELATRRALSVVQAHTSWVNCCALTTDRRWLISAGTDGALRVWERSLLQQEIVDGHIDWVNALALSPDGTEIATGGNDNTVRLWSADDGRSAGTWRAQSAVWSCTYGADRHRLAAVAVGGTYLLRHTTDGWSADLVDAGHSPNRCARSPDGRLLAVIGLTGEVMVVSTDDPQDRPVHYDHERARAALFLDDASLLIGDSDGTLVRWDFRTDSPAITLASGFPGITAIRPLTADSRIACFTYTDVRIMDTRTRRVVATLPAASESAAINDGCVSRDDRRAATVDDRGVLRVFDLDTLELTASTRVDGALFACAWGLDSATIHAAGRRGVYAFTFHAGEKSSHEAKSVIPDPDRH